MSRHAWNAEPGATLKSLEEDGAWRHFPYAVLAPAVLYTKRHPANPRYRDPAKLRLALRIGDFLAAEDARGNYQYRQG